MAKSFIHYHNIKGNLYASVYTPRKVNGKKDNQPQYLGRVIDKEKGIYQNRERGALRYSLTIHQTCAHRIIRPSSVCVRCHRPPEAFRRILFLHEESDRQQKLVL